MTNRPIGGNMETLFLLFAISFVASVLLTPVVRSLARRWGLVDRPDNRRKLHQHATPVAGGIAILIAALVSLGVVMLTGNMPWLDQFDGQRLQWIGLAAAAVVISAVGVLDDSGRLRGRHKLLGQLVAIGILIFSGLLIENIRLFHWELELGAAGYLFTAFFLLGAINSLNLLDGMDGLLTTVGLIITLAFSGMAILSGKWPTACLAVAMAGGLLGFLRYNFPPASIYLGDTGSMLIGLVIGALAIQSSLKGAATVALAAPVAVLCIPILDTVAAVLRRKLTGRSIYTTDRGHLHHCLLKRGFSKVGVLLFVSLFCLVAVIGALLSIAFNSEWIAIVATATVAIFLVGMRWFGDAEVQLIADRLKSLFGSFLRFRSHDAPVESEVRLQGNGSWSEVWADFTSAASDLNLKTIRLDINAPSLHEGYHARWVNPVNEHNEAGNSCWSVGIPLTFHDNTVGRLEVGGFHDERPVWEKIAVLTKVVGDVEVKLDNLAVESGIIRPAMTTAVASAPKPVPMFHMESAK